MRDLDALVALEQAVFTTDILSRRSFRHFLASPHASLIVAEESGKLAGYALVLYPPRSKLARLYSIAVAPHIGQPRHRPAAAGGGGSGGKRAGSAGPCGSKSTSTTPARLRATKSQVTGCSAGTIDYYDDHGDALRFEKPLRARGKSSSLTVTARIGFDGGHRRRRSRQSDFDSGYDESCRA